MNKLNLLVAVTALALTLIARAGVAASFSQAADATIKAAETSGRASAWHSPLVPVRPCFALGRRGSLASPCRSGPRSGALLIQSSVRRTRFRALTRARNSADRYPDRCSRTGGDDASADAIAPSASSDGPSRWHPSFR